MCRIVIIIIIGTFHEEIMCVEIYSFEYFAYLFRTYFMGCLEILIYLKRCTISFKLEQIFFLPYIHFSFPFEIYMYTDFSLPR